MEHSFDIWIATKYGVNCAILLKHICYWVTRNEHNGKNFQNDKYWTYNSIKAFSELFPYMGEKQIRLALKRLEEEELIEVGIFNKDQRDRTKWYTVTEKGRKLIDVNKNINGQAPFAKMAKGDAQKDGPLPDIKHTNIEGSTNMEGSASTEESAKIDFCCSFEQQGINNNYIKGIDEAIGLWNNLVEIGIKPVTKVTRGTKRYSSLVARLREYGIEDYKKAIDKIRNSDFLQGKHGGRPWKITFDWFVLPNNFPKVLEGNYDNEDSLGDAQEYYKKKRDEEKQKKYEDFKRRFLAMKD